MGSASPSFRVKIPKIFKTHHHLETLCSSNGLAFSNVPMFFSGFECFFVCRIWKNKGQNLSCSKNWSFFSENKGCDLPGTPRWDFSSYQLGWREHLKILYYLIPPKTTWTVHDSRSNKLSRYVTQGGLPLISRKKKLYINGRKKIVTEVITLLNRGPFTIPITGF